MEAWRTDSPFEEIGRSGQIALIWATHSVGRLRPADLTRLCLLMEGRSLALREA